jgi:hypothetical protein
MIGRLQGEPPDGGQADVDAGRRQAFVLQFDPVLLDSGLVELAARLILEPDEELL